MPLTVELDGMRRKNILVTVEKSGILFSIVLASLPEIQYNHTT